MEFRSTQPIYHQIADWFCDNILTENWKTGEKIPSVREVAVMMEVNPNTAMRAFTWIQDNNIIYNKRGIGYFVADDGREKARELKKATFVKEELPNLFRTMKILNMTCEEMEKLYRKQTK